MSETDNGGPAFPVPAIGDQAQLPDTGMSLRDWFAGQALCGLISYPNGQANCNILAVDSYAMADAMIAARKAEK